MITIQRVQFLCGFLKNLPKNTGFLRFPWLFLYSRAHLICGADPYEFDFFRLFDYSLPKLRAFMSLHKCAVINRVLLADATEADKAVIGEKALFNRSFSRFIRRDWLYIPDSSADEIASFVRRNPVFLAKKNYSTQGKNIFLFRREELDPEAFAAEYEGQDFLLEAFIEQHPAVSAFNHSSVNTVRVVTACYKGQTLHLGASLRLGGKDAFVDNFHSGGVAYPIDLKTGIVSGRGRDYEGRYYLRHPSTDRIVPGFQIPFWDSILAETAEAARSIPSVGYIGWDIAVTPEGIDFVEGNVEYPGPTIMQLDRTDCYKTLTDWMKSCGCTQRRA